MRGWFIRKYADTARLKRLQFYDPNRNSGDFVHALQDTPASWTPMINALYEDPDIRRRYQFWVYSYPSGYPYPYSAAQFRKELDAVDKAFPGHKKFVLIGHSMGGIISRLMITDVGDKIRRDFFGKPPAQTNISGETRTLLEETLSLVIARTSHASFSFVRPLAERRWERIGLRKSGRAWCECRFWSRPFHIARSCSDGP